MLEICRAGTLPTARLSGTYNISISGNAATATTASGISGVNLDALSDVVITSPSSSQILSYNGTQWVNSTVSGLAARGTSNVTATNLGSTGTANLSITTPKTYALLKIYTSHAAWVTLYVDTASRTADASRTENTDPLPGSGVIAEVITTGATTQLISPGTIAYNADGTGTTYVKIVNKSGSTANLQVTLTYVQLELDMEEKIYVVTLYNKEDLEQFYDEMATNGFRLSMKRPTSRNTHYWMTEEQAEQLKQHSMVWDVKSADSFQIRSQAIVNNNSYTKSGNFWKDDTVAQQLFHK